MRNRIKEITNLIENKKGFDIEVLKMNEEYFVDIVIIATTLGDKHTIALIEYLKEILPKKEILNIEESEEWSVIDLGDLLIHLMVEEYREKYKLEEFLKNLNKPYLTNRS